MAVPDGLVLHEMGMSGPTRKGWGYCSPAEEEHFTGGADRWCPRCRENLDAGPDSG